jgi:hypothetical protein
MRFEMLETVRTYRWMIALLLLLVGQVTAVHASSEVRCTGADGAAKVGLAESGVPHDDTLLTPSTPLAADHEHGIPADPLPTVSAAACSAVAFLSAQAPGADLPPLIEAPPVSVDAALPRLLADSFFRPPRSS